MNKLDITLIFALVLIIIISSSMTSSNYTRVTTQNDDIIYQKVLEYLHEEEQYMTGDSKTVSKVLNNVDYKLNFNFRDFDITKEEYELRMTSDLLENKVFVTRINDLSNINKIKDVNLLNQLRIKDSVISVNEGYELYVRKNNLWRSIKTISDLTDIESIMITVNDSYVSFSLSKFSNKIQTKEFSLEFKQDNVVCEFENKSTEIILVFGSIKKVLNTNNNKCFINGIPSSIIVKYGGNSVANYDVGIKCILNGKSVVDKKIIRKILLSN